MESKITVPLESVSDESIPVILTFAPGIGALVCMSTTVRSNFGFRICLFIIDFVIDRKNRSFTGQIRKQTHASRAYVQALTFRIIPPSAFIGTEYYWLLLPMIFLQP